MTGLGSRNWRERLQVSRALGTGFAAPGGEFTRALFEWSLSPVGAFLQDLMRGRRVVEIGAGMMPYGYALAAHAGAKNFVAVEPFYGDRQEIAQKAYMAEELREEIRIPRKVSKKDVLAYLEDEPDELLCLLACGIEDCILPGPDYKLKVEREIERTLEPDAFFISSHSDLRPAGLIEREFVFPRPSNPKLMDRLRVHGSKLAYELFGGKLPDERSLGSLGG
ncbi:MAG: hypothetical protein P8M67_00025 [Opitutales bacterium]|nr:hypothetical protein [Opitutales bacterium]